MKQAVGWFGKELHARNLVKMTELSVDVYKAAHALSRQQGGLKCQQPLTGFSEGSDTLGFSS